MPTQLTFWGLKLRDTQAVRQRILLSSLFLIALLGLLEWVLKADVSLGTLYTVPVALSGLVLNRKQVLLVAIGCAILRGQFTPYLSLVESAARFLMATIAYSAAGLLVVEVSYNRRRVVEHFARLDLEQRLRRKAEEQLRILVESSPAAIVTLNSDATVAAANRAAGEMFGCGHAALVGASIEPYFPIFVRALAFSSERPVRSSVSGWAHHASGATFPVQAWFSTYGAGSDHALAAILVDMSEEVRDRERENFRQLVDHHRLLAGAVSHEIRNLCSAASVVCTNLARSRELSASPDFDALRSLLAGLTRIASIELQHDPANLHPIELRPVLDQLLVVVGPDWTDIDGNLKLNLPDKLPTVYADAHDLLQIFLNLSQNSCRAVTNEPVRELQISAVASSGQVTVRFDDSGRGVTDASILFQPFRAEADGTGLGLYVSRALARSFGGDLIYIPTPDGPAAPGCRFEIVLRSGAPA